MWRRIVGGIFLIVATWGIPATQTHADTSSYLNVWVHYDYMVGPGYSDAPSAAAMQIVVNAFKAHGVALHIDPQHTPVPGHAVIVPDWQSEYTATPGFDNPSCTGPDAVRFSTLKARYFHPAARHPWHYAVFGNLVFGDTPAHLDNCPATIENGNAPPLYGMTGDSQVGFLDAQGGLGYNFVVTTGSWRFARRAVPDRFEASYFMHELGHNLGLGHGGPMPGDDGPFTNYKPNYLSVMNYLFTGGIPYAATPGSTTIAGYRVDYSDVALPDLQECAFPSPCSGGSSSYQGLDERAGIQDTAHPTDVTYTNTDGFCDTPVPALGPIDWNDDGNTTDTNLTSDINCDSSISVLRGADDWTWIHSRLTPPAITTVAYDLLTPNLLDVGGLNLMCPATVIFTGGASAQAWGCGADESPNTFFNVFVPAGAQSGPITVITPEGTVTSSESLTVAP